MSIQVRCHSCRRPLNAPDNLRATQITDAGLVHLKKLKQLETLTLTGARVTDAGVADLQAALPRVRIVR
jgi:hypothetical protein